MGAREHYESALRALQLGEADPLRPAQDALREAPDFVAAHVLVATQLLYSRDPREYRAGTAAFERLAALPMSEGERRHAAALRKALDGDYRAAREAYDKVLAHAPRDFLALSGAQIIDYYLGEPQALLARVEHVLPAWSRSDPAYHAVLAMLAFGLEECGHYAAAEGAARRALELEPRDRRALHALLHVHEMQGRAEEGLRLVHGNVELSNHLWWHGALFALEANGAQDALAIYERRMRLGGLADLIDASALLWRLSLGGVDASPWFAAVAAHWAPHAEDAHCAFNDLHAMMAFVGAGRWALGERLLAAQERRLALRAGANYDMTRWVGLPACRALYAFGRGDYALAEHLLRALPPVAHRLGGSHAQRDVLQLTRAAAAAGTLMRATGARRSAPRSAGGWRRAARGPTRSRYQTS